MTSIEGHADSVLTLKSPGIALRAYTACTSTLGMLNIITGCWHMVGQKCNGDHCKSNC